MLQKASDPDGDILSIASIGAAGPVGTASIGEGIDKYTDCHETVRVDFPNDWTGKITVPFTVTDDHGSTDSASLTITIVNSAPVAAADALGVIDDKNGSAATDWTLPVLCNDSDPDGDTFHITAATTSVGSVEISSDSSKCKSTKNILVWHAGSYRGAVTLTYTISDGTDTSKATVRLCAEDPANPVYCP